MGDVELELRLKAELLSNDSLEMEPFSVCTEDGGALRCRPCCFCFLCSVGSGEGLGLFECLRPPRWAPMLSRKYVNFYFNE